MEAQAQEIQFSRADMRPSNINLLSIHNPKTGKQKTVIVADQ